MFFFWQTEFCSEKCMFIMITRCKACLWSDYLLGTSEIQIKTSCQISNFVSCLPTTAYVIWFVNERDGTIRTWRVALCVTIWTDCIVCAFFHADSVQLFITIHLHYYWTIKVDALKCSKWITVNVELYLFKPVTDAQ